MLAALVLAGCASELVVVLPDEDGSVGAVDVRRDGDVVTLDTAYAGARTEPLQGTAAVSVAADSVDRDFGAALAALPPEPVSYVLYFAEGTTRVVPASRPALEAMLADVRGRAVVEVQVTGHTDRVGSVADNDLLARERAAMVRSVLIREGLDSSTILAVGRGEREPIVPTADGVREPRNRRVEVTLR